MRSYRLTPNMTEVRMRISLEFKREDMWIGAYWRHDSAYCRTYLWVCLLPCFPICFTWDTTMKEVRFLAPKIKKARKMLSGEHGEDGRRGAKYDGT